MKNLGALVIIIFLTFVSACSTWNRSQQTLPPSRVVRTLPPGDPTPALLPAYRGPHPSQLQRPAETFAFPIAIGAIGPSESLFSGPNQYPFACGTMASGLGAPEIDNHDGIGTPVYARRGEIDVLRGYSKDCLARTQVFYFYKPRQSEQFKPWHNKVSDVDVATLNNVPVPFIVRVEIGTINRFIYVLAALRGDNEDSNQARNDHWNRRLIYQFQGGVGIGYRQGDIKASSLLNHRRAELALGYAVAYSTGNATTNHYHVWLQEDTALRVKKQFAAQYGEPLYTVGIGGSGGGLQQYLLAQNHPGLIDAGIAQYAYPDMITQTIAVFDCELLEYYFDVTAADNERWQLAENRQLIEGYSASNRHQDPYAFLRRIQMVLNGKWPSLPTGQTECAKSWRGLTPLVLNPRFVSFSKHFDADVIRQTHWSHFDDVRTLYGTDEFGFARVPWGNVGVQYGLQALRDQQLSPREFLRLNARIGSWKDRRKMNVERFAGLAGNADSSLRQFSLWSDHNMRRSKQGHVAPRHRGDPAAVSAAFRSGLIFLGKIDIPIIDLRHYLDPRQDMHHAMASFSTRARIVSAGGDMRLQPIWMSARPNDPTPQAFAAIDEWLQHKREHPELTLAQTRPASAEDRCFDRKGTVLAAGDRVWDGLWNQHDNGVCQQRYPNFSDPRQQAGMQINGDVFNCALQSIDVAISGGEYGAVDMSPWRNKLQQIFPDGVCDYRKPDPDRPDDLL